MTKMNLKRPCNDCPWRRKSMKGWLGDASPEEFLGAQQTQDMPCHQTVDYNQRDWEDRLDDASACIGGLQFLANSSALHYVREIAERVKAVGKNLDVFNWRHEFLEHHNGSDFKSWEYKDGR